MVPSSRLPYLTRPHRKQHPLRARKRPVQPCRNVLANRTIIESGNFRGPQVSGRELLLRCRRSQPSEDGNYPRAQKQPTRGHGYVDA